MSARKRTYVGFGAFLGLEAGLVWILNTPPARRHFQRLIESGGFDFTDYWSMLSLSFLIISWTVFLLGGIGQSRRWRNEVAQKGRCEARCVRRRRSGLRGRQVRV
jgi:hypothetical protein